MCDLFSRTIPILRALGLLDLVPAWTLFKPPWNLYIKLHSNVYSLYILWLWAAF